MSEIFDRKKTYSLYFALGAVHFRLILVFAALEAAQFPQYYRDNYLCLG